MPVATITKIDAIEGAARRLGCLLEGTLTAATTTLLTIGSGNSARYFRTNRAGVSNVGLLGNEVYLLQATPPTPNPNVISGQNVTTGTLTPAVDYSSAPTGTGTFDMFLKGVRYVDLEAALNETLRGLYYEAQIPVSFVVDGDMEASGTTDWTASNATLSKDTGAFDLYAGARALRVLATLAGGYARSTAILVDPTNAATWYVRANVRADVGTARLIAYDNTNGADIDTEDWTLRGWGVSDRQFALPSTCESLVFRLQSVENADSTFWDQLIAFPVGATAIPLPDWLLDPHNDIRAVYTLPQGENRAFVERRVPQRFSIVPDMLNPNRQWMLHLPDGLYDPTYMSVTRNYPTVTADSDTMVVPQDLIELGIATRVARKMLDSLGPAGAKEWRPKWRDMLRDYNVKRKSHGPQIISRNTAG